MTWDKHSGNLSPEGILVCEEAKTSDHYCSPSSKAFERYQTLWTTLRELKGADPDYGVKLIGVLERYGVSVTRENHSTKNLPIGELRKIFSNNLEETKNQLIELNLSNALEIDRLIMDLYQLVSDPALTMRFSGSCQVAGIKKGVSM